MSKRKIGIVDYGIGNHASVINIFKSLGYQSIISSAPTDLANTDLLVLPGVGAYPAAMSSLHKNGLVRFLRDSGEGGRPILGFCLGMQLLADESLEYGVTPGLGLIAGKVIPFDHDYSHIGWNSIEVKNNDVFLLPSNDDFFYFNHSYMFKTSSEYQICLSYADIPFVAGVRKNKVLGLQFHPEKSQEAGRKLLKNLVEGLTSD